MTRRKAYQWLAAVLFVVLLAVIFIVPVPGSGQGGEADEAAVGSAQLPQASAPVADAASPHRSPSAPARTASAAHGQHTAPAPVSPPDHIFRKSNRVEVELNSADSLDLVQLYDIGPVFARRILKYRMRLGGYVCKEQLWEVYGMDSARYNAIAPFVTVDPAGVSPLDLNTATLDELKHHPYLDYYQAKAIVRLREEAGLYNDVQDLRKIPIIDEETYTKIKPYLTCNSQQNK